MKNTRILNYSMVILYTAGLAALAALIEAIFFWAGVAAPGQMREIAAPVAETGFSVTVIAVSILAVITNMSEQRYFGIKAGEYLKFRHRPLTPGFYDVLVIIVLVGALQFVALGLGALFAAAVMFLQIVALMVVQIRWGLGIAFFYYGKEREIRHFFMNELESNLKQIACGKEDSRRCERAAGAVTSRIDQLFTHTRRAAATHQGAELEQNLSMLTNVLKMLLDPSLQSVWHNFETRLDSLIAQLMHGDENREYALWALSHSLGVIMDTMGDKDKSKTVAQNCDFDQSRAAAYDMASYAQTRVLREMFEAQLYYKLAVVKVYGIRSDTRKVARYAHYTAQFAQNAAASQNGTELREFILGSIADLAPVCFKGGKATDAAFYTCLLIDALVHHGISLNGLRQTLEARVHGSGDEKKHHSVYMLMRTMQKSLGMPQDLPPQDDASEKAVAELKRLLNTKPK